MKKKVAVLMGGISTEREVSLNSGKSVVDALDRDKYEVYEIILNDKEDVLTQICRHYLMACMCPRHMNMDKIKLRKAYVDELAKKFHADGLIYEQMKFCDPWAYERMTGTYILREEYKYPVLSIDRPYSVGSSGQIRTRVQAFVESIEIKKIQGGTK